MGVWETGRCTYTVDDGTIDSRMHRLWASAFWVQRMGLGAVEGETHPLLASLA